MCLDSSHRNPLLTTPDTEKRQMTAADYHLNIFERFTWLILA